jgi:hypothetical protein
MIAPIAALVFATAMALSLSVEADSFFHTPVKATAEPSEAGPEASAEGEDVTLDEQAGSTTVR